MITEVYMKQLHAGFRVSHPESVERAGLQVLHFCIRDGATLGIPLCTVLFTVLHLQTHELVRYKYVLINSIKY